MQAEGVQPNTLIKNQNESGNVKSINKTGNTGNEHNRLETDKTQETVQPSNE